MKAIKFKIVNLIVAAIVALLAVGQAFAWFINSASDTPDFMGSSSQGYYAGGKGTKDDPYVINKPVHLYNLAWLQNNGFYDDNTYYFELDENLTAALDMQSGTKYIIPPVGNYQHPFKGVFNGNGKTIKDLKVSTNKKVLTVSASTNLDEYQFSNYVGLFGATAEGSSITNFILENPTVEIANERETLTIVDTAYAANEIAAGEAPAAGLAVGQVNGLVQSVGVNGGKLLVRKAGYTTYNTILGALGADIDSSITGGGKPSEGTGIGFGGSLDFASIYDRISFMHKNTWTTPTFEVTSSSVTPYQASGDKISVLVGGTNIACYTTNYVPLMVSNDITADFYNDTNNTAEIVDDNNIGYYTGNQIKLTKKSAQNSIGSSDYTKNAAGKVTDVTIYTKNTNASEQITNVEVDADIKSDVIAMVDDALTDGNFYGVRPRYQVGQNDLVQISNIKVAGTSYDTYSYIPSQAIWFVPQMDGFVKIVLTSANDGTKGGFDIYELTRESQNSDNPYAVRYSSVTAISTIFNDDGETVYSSEWPKNLVAGKLYYFEIPVKGGHEYAFGAQSNSNNPYILYMDVGQNAAADVNDKQDGKVSAIDFVYSGVTINQEETSTGIPAGNFVVGDKVYVATQTSVYFSLAADYTAVLALYIVRSDTSPYGLSVTASDGNGGGKDLVQLNGNGSGSVTPAYGAISPMYFE